jgi:hypothetical protein
MATPYNHQLVQLVVSERYVCMFGGELNSGHCDALLQIELKDRERLLRRFVS